MAKRGNKRGNRRRPSEPADITEAKRARIRAAEDAKLRADGIDPKIARWGEDEVTRTRQAELEGKGVEVVLDQRRRMKRAHVKDVWEEMHTGKWASISRQELDAVRRLQELMLIRAGFGGRDEAKANDPDRRRREEERLRDPCLVNDTMLFAAEEAELTLELVGPPLAAVLKALLDPLAVPASRRKIVAGEQTKTKEGYAFHTFEIVSVEDWRAAVERVVGERRPEVQGAMLRQAARALVIVAPKVAQRLHGGRLPEVLEKRTHPFGHGAEVAA